MDKKIITILLLAAFIYPTKVSASAYQRFYTGVRPIAMGGAFIAVADDRNTIFYNPAGLSRVKSFTLNILNPAVSIGENSLDMYKDMNDIDMDDTGEVSDLLRKHTGDYLHLYASLTPGVGFRIKDFGVMINALAIGNLDSEVRNPVYPEFHLNGHVDVGGIGGIGFKLPGLQNLRAGIAFKAISRESINEVYTPAEIASDNFNDQLDNDKETGSGTSFDLGLIYTLPWNKWFETDLAVSGENIPEIDFDNGEKLKTVWTAGLALRKKIGAFSLLGAIDYRDMTKNLGNDNDLGKRLHIGTEIKFKELFALRAGLNQGYPTYGIGLDVWILKLDAAVYSEEVGAYSGQREDKRYIGQLTIGW